MNLKKLLSIAICTGLLLMSSCHSVDNAQTEQCIITENESTVSDAVIYKSKDVEVKNMDNPSEIQYIYSDWAEPPTYEEAFTNNSVILTGTAANVIPATVKYEYLGHTVSDKITIFDLSVEDVLYCRSETIRQGDIVTIGVLFNQSFYPEGIPLIEEGLTYMIFCYHASEDPANDIMELDRYVDCWIGDCLYLFLEKVGDSYLSIYSFDDLPGALSVAECMNLTDEIIYALKNVPNDKEYVSKYIENNIIPNAKTDNTDVANALCVLKLRTMPKSNELRFLSDHAYVINCNELEVFVRSSAETYNN